jgi:hypothetical protein
MEQVENDGLESKNVFVFMYETNSGDLALNYLPTEHSYIQAKNERNYQPSIKRGSRSLIHMPCRSRSSVDLVVFS